MSVWLSRAYSSARPAITVTPAPAIAAGNAQLQRLSSESGTVSGVMVGWRTMFPPPDFVRGYGEAVEDGSERFFRQFELEAEHQRELDKSRFNVQHIQLEYIRKERGRSQYIAGAYAFGALILSGFLAYFGSPGYATTVTTTSIASVVVAFLTFGRQSVPIRK